MTGNDLSEWVMRGSASATIIYNDPVWSEQEYAMQRGERMRGDFDPPVPVYLVDALRARWSETNALSDRMAVEGRDTLPDDADADAWAAIDRDMLIAGRYAGDRGIRWVPRALLADYQALVTTPLNITPAPRKASARTSPPGDWQRRMKSCGCGPTSSCCCARANTRSRSRKSATTTSASSRGCSIRRD